MSVGGKSERNHVTGPLNHVTGLQPEKFGHPCLKGPRSRCWLRCSRWMASSPGHHKDGSCCSHHMAAPSVHQTLDEMDFERGIWCAALNGDLERVKRHILSRGKPSEPDAFGYTALHYASRNGHHDVCQFLLESGAHCNAQTHGGATPLHRAAFCGQVEVAKLLLRHGADPAVTDDEGRTCLHKAAENGHHELCAILLAHNTDLKRVRDKNLKCACDLVPDMDKELKKRLEDP